MLYKYCSLEYEWIKNFVVSADVFEKVPQKWSLLNLSKRDNIIINKFDLFLKTLLQQSLNISLLLFADLLSAAFPIGNILIVSVL